jgi:leucyl aminopeptidase (aminopeptidase T)
MEQNGGKYKRDDLIQVIVKMRIEKQCSIRTVLSFLMNDLGYAQSYAYELIREAKKYVAEIYKDNNVGSLEEAIAELEEQREVAKIEKNRKLVLDISREIYKLKQLYVERVQHSGEVSYKVKFPDKSKKENE